MAELWIGTSGWVYKHWMGIFYPHGPAAAQQLPYYAERFRTVEVNYSFYRLPERGAFETWRAQTPDGFLFAVKGSRFLTHMKKLKDPEEPLAHLLDRASGLGDKLGPILFQLPPRWSVDTGRLAAFLRALAPHAPQRFALEFRDASWLRAEVFALLESAGVALCLPISPAVPLDVRLTAPWTYIRFHGGRQGIGFGDEELQLWAERIRGFREAHAGVYAYFNNDPEGHALRDAERLRAMLT